MERAGLCGLVVLLWAQGSACTESQGPMDRDGPYPTEGRAATPNPPLYYSKENRVGCYCEAVLELDRVEAEGWAAVLSVAALFVALLVCTLLCCCSIYFSGSQPPWRPLNAEWLPMEDLDSSLESPAPVTFQPSGSTGDPQGHLDTPPSSPVVQFHRAYGESLEDLVHRDVSPCISPTSMETEPPTEH